MATSLEFTAVEKQELQQAMPQIENLLNESSEARSSFLRSPLAFLRKRFNIKLLEYIARSKESIKNFEEAVRDIFEGLKELFNPCLACKLAALIIIYGILGKYSIAVDAMLSHIDKFVDFLIDFFGGVGKRTNEFLEWLEGTAKKIKPSSLALEFCRFIGACSPLGREGQLVGAPIAPLPA